MQEETLHENDDGAEVEQCSLCNRRAIHSFCTLVRNKLFNPDIDGVLSKEKYAGYLSKCSFF
jgi:hypothetical protein